MSQLVVDGSPLATIEFCGFPMENWSPDTPIVPAPELVPDATSPTWLSSARSYAWQPLASGACPAWENQYNWEDHNQTNEIEIDKNSDRIQRMNAILFYRLIRMGDSTLDGPEAPEVFMFLSLSLSLPLSFSLSLCGFHEAWQTLQSFC